MHPNSHDAVRVLVAGLPRSGTTWVAQILASCEDTALLHEPDNPTVTPFALRKRKLPGGYYSAVGPDDQAQSFQTLWRAAFEPSEGRESPVRRFRRRAAAALFSHAEQDVRAAFTTRPRLSASLRAAEILAVPARPRHARNLVVKSVHAGRALEWISSRVDADVLLVQRDLRGVISSWIEMWGIGEGEDNELEVADPGGLERTTAEMHILPPPSDPLGRTTWLLAVLQRLMNEAAARHPGWTTVRYEDLCDNSTAAFRDLARQVRLTWRPQSEELLHAKNRPGKGYDTRRIAAEARDIWRSRLTAEQEQRVSSIIEAVGTPNGP